MWTCLHSAAKFCKICNKCFHSLSLSRHKNMQASQVQAPSQALKFADAWECSIATLGKGLSSVPLRESKFAGWGRERGSGVSAYSSGCKQATHSEHGECQSFSDKVFALLTHETTLPTMAHEYSGTAEHMSRSKVSRNKGWARSSS